MHRNLFPILDMFLIYARRSTDDADNQKNSLEYQEDESRRYAEKNKLPLSSENIDGFLDSGVIKERHSAFKSSALSVSGAGLVEYQIERPKFMRMIQLLLEKKYEGVIVLCWDRISRNEQSDLIVKEIIKKHGICVRFVQAEYDIKTSSGELHMDIDGMFARHHSRVTSEKVKLAIRKLREQKRCTHNACIGYLDQGSDNKLFDPERAPLIKRMFEMYDTGEWSLRELMKWVNAQGLTTKPRRRRRTRIEILQGIEMTEKQSKALSISTVEFILKNKFYIGLMPDNGDWIQGCHPPLVDVELFKRVQQRLGENCVTVQYMEKESFTYREFFRCSCGRAYSPYRSKKNGEVYYSSKCKEDCPNTRRNIQERFLDEEIQKLLDKLHFNDEELAEIEKGKKSGIQKASAKRNQQIDDLNRAREKILADLDYLKNNKITLLREGTYDPASLRDEADDLTEDLEEVDVALSAFTESEKEMLDFVLSFSELIKGASALYKHALDSEKRRLTHLVFSELVLVDGKVADFTAKEEFEPLFKRRGVQDGSPSWVFSEARTIVPLLRSLPLPFFCRVAQLPVESIGR